MRRFIVPLVAITLFALSLFSSGCSSSEPMKTGETRFVENSMDKPDWVEDDRVYWLDDDNKNMYFRLTSDGEPDLPFAWKGLDGQAMAAVLTKVQLRAGLEFDEAVKGSKYNSNSIGQARQWVVNALGDAKFSDLTKEREYWEKYMKQEGVNNISYKYSVYGLYAIAEMEVERAKEEAWKKAHEVAERQADIDAKQLLDEAKARFMGRE